MKKRLLKGLYIKDKGLVYKKTEEKTYFHNPTKERLKIIFLRPILGYSQNCMIHIKGEISYQGNCEFKVINRKKNITHSFNLNDEIFFERLPKMFILGCIIDPNTEVTIYNSLIDKVEFSEYDLLNRFASDTLIISPGYPSNNNKYLFSFVHSRVKEYKKNKFNVDVVAINDHENLNFYEYENIKACSGGYNFLRNLLQIKKYKNIIIHYLKREYTQILDATDLSETNVYIFAHGGDLIYRDMKILTTKYFERTLPFKTEEKEEHANLDEILNRYNDMPNVKFVFGTHWSKQRSEKTNRINFKNSIVIPNVVNDKIFKFKKRTQEQRKRILILRKFDNVNTYGIDTNVRAILHLSKSEIFKDLEFNIYGDGDYHEELLAPLKKFSNVKIYKKFLSHEEMQKIFLDHGIGLFATRYETQGITAAEAAMSGLVVLSSNVCAVNEVFGSDLDNLFGADDYEMYSEKIKELYNNPTAFVQLSRKMSGIINEYYGLNNTIKKELDMFEEDSKKERRSYRYKKQNNSILLTVAVPSYNVEKFLKNGIFSLINHKLSHKMEVLIINDGSKDSTQKIGKELEKITTIEGRSIVRLIDKENGGHGSTINKGIKLARGKYFKLMDGDDYFATSELEKLLNILEKENSDIVLNNYVEDFSITCTMNNVENYNFMIPGKQYNIEDLCFDNYGFTKWGPLLSTSTYKTQMLKEGNFKISENCFYVDMELNYYTFCLAETVSYYPLNLYIYYLGRPGQSVSPESYKRNYKHHEIVTLKIAKKFAENQSLSDNKKRYLKDKIIIPLVVAQYYIITEYLNYSAPFKYFDKQIKNYSDLYNHPDVAIRRVKINRATNGLLINVIRNYVKIKNFVKSLFITEKPD